MDHRLETYNNSSPIYWDRGLATSAAFILAATLSFISTEPVSAQEQDAMRPTGITDVDYRSQCGVPVEGSGPATRVDILYLKNSGKDAATVDVNGSGPTTDGQVDVTELLLTPAETGATVVPGGIKRLFLGRLSTGEVAEIHFACYDEGPTEEQPTEPPEPTPTPSATAGPEPSPSPAPAPSPSVTSPAPSPEAAATPPTTVRRPVTDTPKITTPEAQQHQPANAIQKDASSGVPITSRPPRHPNTPASQEELPKTGQDVARLLRSGLFSICFGTVLLYVGKKLPQPRNYKPRHRVPRAQKT